MNVAIGGQGATAFRDMKIFLSYAQEDRNQAESIYLALRDQKHRVFFDRADLPAGEEYHNRIRAAIEDADLFVFMISPEAVDAGSYTLSELAIAQRAGLHLFPVMLRPLEISQLPASVQAVTIYRTDGNLAAGVAAEIYRIARDRRRGQTKRFAVASVIIAALAGLVLHFLGRRPEAVHEFAGRDGAPALLIPGGVFIMGDDENSPRREIFVDAFYLDKYEVTVGRYARFLQAVPLSLPQEWDTIDLRKHAKLPVVGVGWHDADSYCRWIGKRLPTEAEWEKAARGSDQRKYPWGDDAPTLQRARFGRLHGSAVYEDGVAEAGGHSQGASPFGIHDLSGNVWEWVADWYSESFPPGETRNPTGPAQGRAKVLRGGGWYDGPERLRSTVRMYSSPDQRDTGIGFRCARDIG